MVPADGIVRIDIAGGEILRTHTAFEEVITELDLVDIRKSTNRCLSVRTEVLLFVNVHSKQHRSVRDIPSKGLNMAVASGLSRECLNALPNSVLPCPVAQLTCIDTPLRVCTSWDLESST